MAPLSERLVHAAAMQLVEHAPGDERTDAAARKAVAAVLREQLNWLEAWKLRVKDGFTDRKVGANQAVAIGLLKLKFIETLSLVECPSPPAVTEGSTPDE